MRGDIIGIKEEKKKEDEVFEKENKTAVRNVVIIIKGSKREKLKTIKEGSIVEMRWQKEIDQSRSFIKAHS